MANDHVGAELAASFAVKLGEPMGFGVIEEEDTHGSKTIFVALLRAKLKFTEHAG